VIAKNPTHISVPLVGICRDAQWAILKQAKGKLAKEVSGTQNTSHEQMESPFLTFAMYVFMRRSSQSRQEHVELSAMYGPDMPGHAGVVVHPLPQAYGSFPSGSSPPFRCAKEERSARLNVGRFAESQHTAA